MSKPANAGKRWTPTDKKELKDLAKQGASTPEIAKELKRTKIAIQDEASKLNVSLNPRDT